MNATTTLYRVLAKTTGSLQPGRDCNTSWQTEVLYCGYDRQKAARIYHESTPRDYFCGYGNRCRRTEGQRKEISE